MKGGGRRAKTSVAAAAHDHVQRPPRSGHKGGGRRTAATRAEAAVEQTKAHRQQRNDDK